MVSVVEPLLVMDAGLKVHVANAGRPEQANVTGLGVKEFTAIGQTAGWPAVTVMESSSDELIAAGSAARSGDAHRTVLAEKIEILAGCYIGKELW
jgi:hypothetical protein